MKFRLFHKGIAMPKMFQQVGWLVLLLFSTMAQASSHREAPLIANDPLADNVDVYAFRSPDAPNTVTLMATYVPLQLPHGGPNYYGFGENIRYEIHVDNDASKPGDEVTYRFVFNIENEDPTTFFNIRLGQQNLKTTYKLYKSMDGGRRWHLIVEDGYVPPTNIGPRSIEGPVGLASGYDDLMAKGITNAYSGEKVFVGPVDDPFFVDLGGVFDLGNSPRQDGQPRDGLACFNVSAIAIQVPIKDLLKDGAPETPTSILDPDYVIGVWASASRKSIRTFYKSNEIHHGSWTQVSRLGMPLTNEVVIPIGKKDFWNALSPYRELADQTLDRYFYNPELALYMDDDQFGGAVPAFSPLRIQRNALGAFDFGNGQNGLQGLKGSEALAGTALDDEVFGALLLPGEGKPRAVDLWPIFHTGVPNLPPYQLATGKDGNPLAPGKPFINNFLPNGGDMLRLNMAVPPTPRNSEAFSSLGVIQAAVLGLLDPNYNTNTDIQFIPNMDGFPNGRRLEDDVTRIELQAVGGIALAAIGLWYDDFDPEVNNPVTEQLLGVLEYSTGVEVNDKNFVPAFPYLAAPWRGTDNCIDNNAVVEEPTDPTGMIDLELRLESDATQVSQFQSFNLTVTIENKGDMAATGVTVSIPIPEELVLLGTTADAGAYNRYFRRWDVGTLAPGAMTTIDLEVFAQATNVTITNFVQVATAMEPDIDSKPGNDLDAVADEDDESALSISLMTTANLAAQVNRQVRNMTVNRLYPIPAKEELTVELNSTLSGIHQIQVFNAEGILVKNQDMELHQGFNKTALDIGDLPPGSYFLSMPTDQEQKIKQQFLIVR